jgi:hypothetical protein
LTKLLSGQKLYIAKSINAQRISESVDAPPYEQPLAEIEACLTAISPANQLLDFDALTLIHNWFPRRSTYFRRLAEASYLSGYLDPNYEPGYIFSNDEFCREIKATQFSSFRQLQLTKYVTMYPRIEGEIQYYPPLYGAVFGFQIPYPKYGYPTMLGYYEFQQVYLGNTVKLTASFTYQEGYSLLIEWDGLPRYNSITVLEHQHPKYTKLEFATGLNPGSPDHWICDRSHGEDCNPYWY